VIVDGLARALVDLFEPIVRDLVRDEVQRVAADLAPIDVGERLFTIRAAAERLAMSETSVRRHITDGRLRVTLVPGRVPGSSERRIRGADLDAFVVGLAGEREVTSMPKGRAPSVRAKLQSPGVAPRLTELVRQRRGARG
jgi:hypothetical protein